VQTVPDLPLEHYAAGGKKGLPIMEVDVGVDVHEVSVEEKFHQASAKLMICSKLDFGHF
jgi:hypothetical protein